MNDATVLIVPGLRDRAPAHWQTWMHQQLEERGQSVVTVPPMGRDELSLYRRIHSMERLIWSIDGPLFVVAHSAGCHLFTHWVRLSSQLNRVRGALLVAPPDLDKPMSEPYPAKHELEAEHWLPMSMNAFPFPSWVGVSANDPLCDASLARKMAHRWGSKTIELGEVGHVNPGSGHGPWPEGLRHLDSVMKECFAPVGVC